ncbi:MAG: DNA primase TraC [bacterium ADurb.Bin212]|nr:MAG: DNA primase TraC [bacterium ADurb.Bin212]
MNIESFLSAEGLTQPPILDGEVHRFKPEGRSDLAGWYIGSEIQNESFKDPLQIITVGNWSTNTQTTFTSKNRFSKDQKKIKDAELERLRKKAEEQKEARREEARKMSVEFFNSAPKATDDHPYLKKKKVKSHGLLLEEDRIAIPVFQSLELFDVHSFQLISPDGSKQFIPGGKIQGGFFIFKGETDCVYVCEGYSTGATVFEATGKTVLIAFSLNNLKNIVLKAIQKYGHENVIICADNDRFQTNPKVGNPGLDVAISISSDLGVSFKYPKFKTDLNQGTDFNDLLVFEGISTVVEQLSASKMDEKHPSLRNGFHFLKVDSKGNESWRPDYLGLAKYFKEEVRYANTEGWQFFYADGYYNKTSDLELDKLIIDQISKVPEREKPSYTLGAFKKYVKANCLYSESDFLDSKFKINMANGVLDVKTKRMAPHNPRYFFKYKNPYDFSPDATCEAWLEFLRDVFDNDQELIDLSAEIFGYTLLGGAPFLHKAFCLIGTGRNGKSVYLNVLKTILSKANYSAVSMEKIGEPFHAVQMDGKLANIVGESPAKATIPSDAFKALVAGDELMVSYKGKDNYEMVPTARLFFASNSDPVFRDNSFGLQERLVIIPFSKTYTDDIIDPFLSDRLVSTEIPGVINWAINGLCRLLERGHLPKVNVSTQAKEAFKMDADSSYYFYRKYFQVVAKEAEETVESIKISSLYPLYCHYCDNSGEHKKSLKVFSRDFKNYIKQDCGHLGVYEMQGYFRTKRLIPSIELQELKNSYFRPNNAKYNEASF